MQFEWRYTHEERITVKMFLKQQGVSRRLLTNIKYDGGKICVNGMEQTVRYLLSLGDVVAITIPNEGVQGIIQGVDMPVDVLYEDDHYIAVNKPSGVASIPSFNHPLYSMANRIKGYYEKQGYANQVIHVVTRLDRDTTGVLLLAKHRFAHALIDEQLKKRTVDKAYIAIAKKPNALEQKGFIEANIAMAPDTIMIRQIGHDGQGQYALTEYECIEQLQHANVYAIKLHTGRTHQIRVHFNYKEATLIGDNLYGAKEDDMMKRQALHCKQIRFYHPFTQQHITIEAPMPEDMLAYIKRG
ncbi:RluA family pseudouridine synthase [Carnobacteriaceae bacterium zg-ZUI240]|nr:RluA family pseudouridine synthase [Carnobacteriaceae bacterium zg-ZUI240]